MGICVLPRDMEMRVKIINVYDKFLERLSADIDFGLT